MSPISQDSWGEQEVPTGGRRNLEQGRKKKKKVT